MYAREHGYSLSCKEDDNSSARNNLVECIQKAEASIAELVEANYANVVKSGIPLLGLSKMNLGTEVADKTGSNIATLIDVTWESDQE